MNNVTLKLGEKMALKHYSTHFCIVSKELAPLFFPIRLEGAKPEKMVIFATQYMKEQGKIFEAHLKQHHIACEIIEVSNDPVAFQDFLMEYFERNKPTFSEWAFNATGGTKPLAFAALEVCQVHNIPAFYIDTHEGKILHLGKSISAEELPVVLGYKDLLELQGYRVQEEEKSSISKDSRQFADALIEKAKQWEGAIGTLNKYAHLAEKKLRVARDPEEDRYFHNVLALCKEYDLVNIKGDRIEFSSEESRLFCNGGWLEEYTFSLIKKLEKKNIFDCTRNIKVQKGDTQSENELDIAFTSKNILYVVEVKTKRISVRDFNQNFSTQVSDDIVYKLETLKDKMGGAFTKAMLVSYRSIREADTARAKLYGVKVVDNTKLKGLAQEIEKWIQ